MKIVRFRSGLKITRLELPSVTGMKTVNAYLIRGDRLTLVDGGEGTTESYETLKRLLQDEGVLISDIEEILITHSHVDHMGGVGRIAEESQAKVRMSDLVEPWARNKEAEWMERSNLIDQTIRSILSPAAYDGAITMYKGMKELMLNIWHEIPQELIEVFPSHAEKIDISGQEWNSIYVPGHSYTQHCFYNEKSRELISADMILRITPTPVIERSTDDPLKREKGIVTMIESYGKIQQLDIDMTYPGHYELIPDTQTTITKQLTRIHQRKDETLQIIKDGANTYIQIFQSLYKGRMDLPAFNMLIGYIDLLDDEGKVHQVDKHDYLHVYPL